MKQLNIKKLVLLNLPYFLLGLFATNLGEAWRLATGADASAKMLSFFSTLPVALGSWWPSLHQLDLLVGLCCGAGLRLAVYLKGKNAKKYRHNVEYGSARCVVFLSPLLRQRTAFLPNCPQKICGQTFPFATYNTAKSSFAKAGQSAARYPGWLTPAFLLFSLFLIEIVRFVRRWPQRGGCGG